MFAKIAKKITESFIALEVIEREKFDVYAYSFEILISLLGYLFIFLFISIITKSLLESFFFLIGFFALRHFAGGFHASDYLKCYILSSITHIIFIILIKTLPISWYLLILCILSIYNLLCIFLFSPVDNENKPFSERELTKFRFESRVYISLISVVLLLVFALIAILQSFVFSFAIGTFFASTSVLVAKVFEHKK